MGCAGRPDLLLCALALFGVCLLPEARARVYTNHWALKIAGGFAEANRIAGKYGFINLGQVSGGSLSPAPDVRLQLWPPVPPPLSPQSSRGPSCTFWLLLISLHAGASLEDPAGSREGGRVSGAARPFCRGRLSARRQPAPAGVDPPPLAAPEK